ncbi:MAG: hypothetical protein WAL22_09590 [Solirubrobacteraceae bacterium]
MATFTVEEPPDEPDELPPPPLEEDFDEELPHPAITATAAISTAMSAQRAARLRRTLVGAVGLSAGRTGIGG